MKTKIVTAYWMDVNGYPFQGSTNVRKPRYLGSLISHCQGIELPVVCYTHSKNLEELNKIKTEYNLSNLEIKILELSDMKYHKQISKIRDEFFNTDLDGRGPEIMWGKFEVIEKELEGFDYVYWLDVGLQHPGIFPWRYSKKYNKIEDHVNLSAPWWSDYDVHNFSSLLNTKIFDNLNLMCENKIALITSINPQISYPFYNLGLIDYTIQTPYPVGGMIGGNTNILKKYIDIFWNFTESVLNYGILCTEEAIMKIALDRMNSEEIVNLYFSAFSSGEHDEFHFNMWNEQSNNQKPFYMIWHDILNYKP